MKAKIYGNLIFLFFTLVFTGFNFSSCTDTVVCECNCPEVSICNPDAGTAKDFYYEYKSDFKSEWGGEYKSDMEWAKWDSEYKDGFNFEQKTDLDFTNDTADSFEDTTDISDVKPDLPSTPPEPRKCEIHIKYKNDFVNSVSIAGEFNGWSKDKNPLQDNDGDGVWETVLDTKNLKPGSYGYKFVLNGSEWVMDPENPYQIYVDGVLNSRLIVEDCNLPLIKLDYLFVDNEQKSISVIATVIDGNDASGITNVSVTVNGNEIGDSVYDPQSQKIEIELTDLENDKYTIRINASNKNGSARELFIPVWIEDKKFSWEKAVLYFAFTDRFANGDPSNDNPSTCLPQDNPANWKGGDFQGIIDKINEGYFDKLGVNAIWISPPYDNPNGCYKGSLDKMYTAYHGYFPVDEWDTEDHFGTFDKLKELIDTAHKHGIRVLMDLVANHVFIDNPLYEEYKDKGGFHDFYKCGWEKPIECWFEEYTPDIDYTNDDMLQTMTDNAIYWIKEAGFDGFRVDAAKHMKDIFLYTLRAKINDYIENPFNHFYTVGETFVGEWGGGSGSEENTIKYYVNDKMLHGQFDFPMYWKLVKTFARYEAPFYEIKDFLLQEKGFYGPHAIMSNFLGNHDVVRFISHANGDIQDLWGNGSKEQGWNNPPSQPSDCAPYKKLELAYAMMFTVKGIPLIYYGDEIGLAGAGDPDNRRVMPWSGYNNCQIELKNYVSKLGKIRSDYDLFSFGDFNELYVENDLFAYRMTHNNQSGIVVINRSFEPKSVTINVSGVAGISSGDKLVDLLTGDTFNVEGGNLNISLNGPRAVILVKK